eukprot:492675-Ditylum_brightwellii.AAC.1
MDETTEHAIACRLLIYGNGFFTSVHLFKDMMCCAEDFSRVALQRQGSTGLSSINWSTVMGRREKGGVH